MFTLCSFVSFFLIIIVVKMISDVVETVLLLLLFFFSATMIKLRNLGGFSDIFIIIHSTLDHRP
jgi:hypothetical protein